MEKGSHNWEEQDNRNYDGAVVATKQNKIQPNSHCKYAKQLRTRLVPHSHIPISFLWSHELNPESSLANQLDVLVQTTMQTERHIRRWQNSLNIFLVRTCKWCSRKNQPRTEPQNPGVTRNISVDFYPHFSSIVRCYIVEREPHINNKKACSPNALTKPLPSPYIHNVHISGKINPTGSCLC